MHSGYLTGDALDSMLCDCGEQLQQSMQMIVNEGRGVIVYIQHYEGRGIGILHKLKAPSAAKGARHDRSRPRWAIPPTRATTALALGCCTISACARCAF